MNKSFNLLDERWIPVSMSDGSKRDVGLLELFEEASQIRALAETSPPSLVALYRLLLAIAHRALTLGLPNGWKDRDRAQWYRQGLPQAALRDYLEAWRERFWLFHPEHPFMQVAVLATADETRDKLKPWTQISLASATGNAPVVFDHSFDAEATRIEPGVAIRSLLGFMQFTPGGLVKVVRDSDKAGPLANCAASIPLGDTLNETLCLALHPCLHSDIQDLPAWEHSAPLLDELRADPSLASGRNDRYTRLSRAVLLRLSEDGRIEKIHFAAGVALAEDVNAADSMVSYRVGSEKLIRLSFRDGRAFWRDLPALVADAVDRPGDKTAQKAAILGFAANLKSLLGEEQGNLAILAAGVTSDQAKLVRWRVEQVVLPVPLLADATLADTLREELQRAEDVYKKLHKIAARMLAETMPDANRKETGERSRTVIDSGPFAANFFAVMERNLPLLMQRIASAQFEEAHEQWSQSLLQAAGATWELLRLGMGQSPSALRAEARAYPRFCALRRSLQPEYALNDSSIEVQA
jgi:CRISPR system Cascade subunit CasA